MNPQPAGPTEGPRVIASRAQQRLLLTGILVSMLFILSPVPPSTLLPFSYPLYWTLLAALLVLALATNRKLLRPTAFSLLLAALAAWMAVASILHPPRLAIELWVWLSGIVLAIYAAGHYGSVFGSRFLCRLFTFVVAFESAICLLQLAVYVKGEPIVATDLLTSLFGDRATYDPARPPIDVRWRFVTGASGLSHRLTVAPGTFWTVNIASVWLTLALPFLLLAWRRAAQAGRSAWRFAYPILAGVALLLIVRNLTRGALLGALVAILVFLALDRRRVESRVPRLRRGLTTAILAACLLLLVLAVGWVDRQAPWAPARTFRGRVLVGAVDDGRLRLRLMGEGLERLLDTPFFGRGYGNYRGAMPRAIEMVEGLSQRKENQFRGRPGRRLSAHNAFLMMGHDGGIPALLLFLSALWVAGRSAWKRRAAWRGDEIALVSALAAALVMAQYYPTLYRESWPLFLFLLGCLRGASTPEGDR